MSVSERSLVLQKKKEQHVRDRLLVSIIERCINITGFDYTYKKAANDYHRSLVLSSSSPWREREAVEVRESLGARLSHDLIFGAIYPH